MLDFWQWMTQLVESVQDQQQRLLTIVQQKFPNMPPAYHQRIIQTFLTAEKSIQNPDDVRKVKTISAYLRSYTPAEGESPAHTIDRMNAELFAAIQKANAKGKTPEQADELSRQELRKRLPDAPPEVIETLLQQIKAGAGLKDVVNKYLANKNSVGAEDKIIAKEGNLELIEIKTWREDGTMEKHLDKNKGVQACHPLFKGTKWCVRFQDYFNSYASSGPLYLIRENGKPLMLGHKDSPWLNTEDEDPDRKDMFRVTKFLYDATMQNKDLAKLIEVVFLERPVEMVEALIAKHGGALKSMRYDLVGDHYQGYENGLIILHSYDWLDEVLKGLQNSYNNKLDFDYETIVDSIQEMASDQDMKISDLVYNLDNKMEDVIINVLNKRYEQGHYGKVDGWEDMELEEALEVDDDLVRIMQDASKTSYEDTTIGNLNKSIMSDLQNGDSNGFFVDTKNWRLCVPVAPVNAFLLDKSNDDWETRRDEDHPFIDKMNFEIDANVDMDFSSKRYNEAIMEQLGQEGI